MFVSGGTLRRMASIRPWHVGAFLVGALLWFFLACDRPFKRNFKEITGEEVPDGADFIYTEESPSDFHGDYGSISIVDVGSDFYQRLPDQLIRKGLAVDTAGPRISEFRHAKHDLNRSSIVDQYMLLDGHRQVYHYVGFLSDKHSLILIRSSW